MSVCESTQPVRNEFSSPTIRSKLSSATASTRFFETLPHRLMGNRFDDVQFDDPFGQQPQRPAGLPRRLDE
jgi:hypothetical protein